MSKSGEKRKFERFNTGLEIIFQVAYDLKTKVNYQKVDRETGQLLTRKYSALSKNVSVEGLCFSCGQKLQPGEILQLEIVSPRNKKPCVMVGEVRWSEPQSDDESKFDSGIKLTEINGEDVNLTFHRDDTNQIVWSGVLQAIIGDFQK